MNKQDELINPRLVQKVKKLYSQAGVLIISPSKTTRNNLKRVLSLIGIPTANISVAEDYTKAKNIIINDGPSIVFSNLYLGDDQSKGAIEIQQVHKSAYPNRLKTIFGVITSLNKPYVTAFAHKYNFDSFMQGDQSFQDLVNEMTRLFSAKVKITQAAILEHKVIEALNLKEPQDALTILENEKTIEELNELKISKYKAIAYTDLKETELATEHFKRVCDKDLDYYCFEYLINNYFVQKDYKNAYKYIKTFLTAYQPLPDEVPTIIRSFLFNKKYKELISFCKMYENDDNISAEVKLNIAAALALCGKSLVTEDLELANETLTTSLVFSGGQSFNILQMVVSSLLVTKANLTKCLEIMEKYRENFIEQKQFLALEFDVLQYIRSPNEILTEGTTLLRQEVKSHSIYEQVIATSIKVGRRKEAVEDIVFEACKEFPTHSDQFKRYMNNL